MSAYPPPPGYGSFPGARHYEKSQATTAMVLGILSLVLCSLLSPFAWGIANKELREIRAGRRDSANTGTANAGKVLGIIGTVLLMVTVVVIIILIAAGAILSN